MTQTIPINLVVEDDLSEAVARRLLAGSRRRYSIGHTYGRTGAGYLKTRIRGFNNAAKGTPYLMLTDLDRAECPPMLLSEWFREAPRHPNLLFRIAVREVESWLLAHRSAFAHFMRISESLIRSDVEAVDDPKEYLINLATKSRRRAIREDVVPLPRSTSRQGPNYNGRLIEYVETAWDPRVAMMLSASLARAVEALDTFSPTWSADAD